MTVQIFTWLFQTAMAIAATIMFSILFQVPKRQLLFTGLTGGTGWLVLNISMYCGQGRVAASFIAAFALTWVARFLAFRRREPVTSFLICGIFPIVPGTALFYTGYYFFMGDNSTSSEMGIQTLRIAVAIALGIGIVLSLPQILFSLKTKKAMESGK